MAKIVLVVEDEKSMLALQESKIRAAGYEVITAMDGNVGYQKAIEEKPDLILLDVAMPELNGFGMLKKLREFSSWGKQVPVIIFTNVELTGDFLREITTSKPAYCFMKINLSIDEVIEKIHELIGQ